jgi:hypothetical protein
MLVSSAGPLRPCGLFFLRGVATSSSLSQRRAPSARRPPPVGDGNPLQDPAGPWSANDRVATHILNRNPMNLEKMRIGRKPTGFPLERLDRSYWNKLDLR